MTQSMMAMMRLMDKCTVSAQRLLRELVADGRLAHHVRFPEVVSGHCFRLEFLTPIEAMSDDGTQTTVTCISVSFVPDKYVQNNLDNPDVIETALVSGKNLVYCSSLRHQDVNRYCIMNELVEMIIWIAEGNSDPVEIHDYGDPSDHEDDQVDEPV